MGAKRKKNGQSSNVYWSMLNKKPSHISLIISCADYVGKKSHYSISRARQLTK